MILLGWPPDCPQQMGMGEDPTCMFGQFGKHSKLLGCQVDFRSKPCHNPAMKIDRNLSQWDCHGMSAGAYVNQIVDVPLDSGHFTVKFGHKGAVRCTLAAQRTNDGLHSLDPRLDFIADRSEQCRAQAIARP